MFLLFTLQTPKSARIDCLLILSLARINAYNCYQKDDKHLAKNVRFGLVPNLLSFPFTHLHVRVLDENENCEDIEKWAIFIFNCL